MSDINQFCKFQFNVITIKSETIMIKKYSKHDKKSDVGNYVHYALILCILLNFIKVFLGTTLFYLLSTQAQLLPISLNLYIVYSPACCALIHFVILSIRNTET